MNKSILTIAILAIGINTILFSQGNEGCLFIDFETIPNSINSSGIEISDQFKEEFGVSFILGNGQRPVVARIGGQLEAFTTFWGDDIPAPNVDVGQYFLTDDGNVSSNLTSPLILEFETPIDSFSGCILDLDFSESFVIEAFDKDDNLILSERIEDGDAGTGDGTLVCWGFNLPGCEGTIYKIVYTGRRLDNSGFGLGLDNFSFCYSGLNIELETINYSCSQPGELIINHQSSDNYEYSVDGITYSNDKVISDLLPGVYSLIVRDSEGCETTYDFEINELSALNAEIELTNTFCGLSNGSINIEPIPNNNALVSLNGSDYSMVYQFDNLPSGDYTISVQDDNGCEYVSAVTILDNNQPPIIINTDATPDYCNLANGEIFIEVEGGTGEIEYQIIDAQNLIGSQLVGLIAGVYQVVVSDELGCTSSTTVEVPIEGEFSIEVIEVLPPRCNGTKAQVFLQSNFANNQVSYSIDGFNFQSNGMIGNLETGEYLINAISENGCESELSVEIPCVTCDVYIPNTFSSTEERSNSEFRIFANENYKADVIKYLIFDKWGSLVFSRNNFSIHSNDAVWWDGYFKGKDVNIGVYTYMIILKDSCGIEKTFVGDVTILR